MKTVYLLASGYSASAVVAFGVGCSLSAFVNERDPFDLGDSEAPMHGVRVNAGPCSFLLSGHDAPQEAEGAVHVWFQAIIGAPEGALLRWDNERGCVVDELAHDEDVFADDLMPVPDALVQDVAQTVAATQWQKCPECGNALYAFPGETVGGCEDPFCPRAVERTEDETEVTRPLLIPTYAPSAEMTGTEAIERAA